MGKNPENRGNPIREAANEADRLQSEGAKTLYAERLARLEALARKLPEKALDPVASPTGCLPSRRLNVSDVLSSLGREGCLAIVEAYLAGASSRTIRARLGVTDRHVAVVLCCFLPTHRNTSWRCTALPVYDNIPGPSRPSVFGEIWKVRRLRLDSMFAPGGILPERLPMVFLLRPPTSHAVLKQIERRCGIIESYAVYEAILRLIEESGEPALFQIADEDGVAHLLTPEQIAGMRSIQAWSGPLDPSELESVLGDLAQQRRKRRDTVTFLRNDPIHREELQALKRDADPEDDEVALP